MGRVQLSPKIGLGAPDTFEFVNHRVNSNVFLVNESSLMTRSACYSGETVITSVVFWLALCVSPRREWAAGLCRCGWWALGRHCWAGVSGSRDVDVRGRMRLCTITKYELCKYCK
jgi:hypothetical protein